MSTELARQGGELIYTPTQQIDAALRQGVTPELMMQLIQVRRELEADEAKKAFNEAFTAFKAEPVRITRDKENTQYSKGDRKAMYTSLENMVATVTPYLSKHGLSASWGVPQQTAQAITVSCTLCHVLGFSRTEAITSGMDDSGAKNKLQQIKSTMTYLKVATFESVCGLASAFGSLSDDGNASGAPQVGSTPDPPKMGDEEYIEYRDAIQGADNRESLKKAYEAAYEAAKKLGDKSAMGDMVRFKDKRKAELA